MRRFDHPAQIGKRPEMIFHAVIINRAITVITRIRTPRLIASRRLVRIVIPRCQPNRRYAQLFEIRHFRRDAFEIAAVPRTRICAVNIFIIRRVAIGESVGHYQINHVVVRNSLKICLFIKRRGNFKRNASFSVRRRNFKLIFPDFRVFRNRHIEKQIIGARIDADVCNLQRFIYRRNFRVLEICAANQKANGIYRMIRPPIRRLDFFNFRRITR